MKIKLQEEVASKISSQLLEAALRITSLTSLKEEGKKLGETIFFDNVQQI